MVILQYCLARRDSRLKNQIRALFISLCFGLAASAKACDQCRVILLNGSVNTLDNARSIAEAVCLGKKTIIFVGSNLEARKHIGANTKVVDLQGKMVLPGFHDSHVHPVSSMLDQMRCSLADLDSRQKIQEAIRNYARNNPERTWITGGGWALPLFPKGSPTRQELDRIVSDRPVYLLSQDAHSAWVNTKALAMAKVDGNSPDPKNGIIEREKDGKTPSGCLRDEACRLITRIMPVEPPEAWLEAAEKSQKYLHSFGITSVIDAHTSKEALAAYQALEKAGKLKLNVSASLLYDPDLGLEQIEELKSLRRQYKSNRLDADSVKIFADGVLESFTAALLEPYCKRGGYGFLSMEPDTMAEVIKKLDSEKFQIHIHAIGDRALRTALDSLEKAKQVNGSRDSRHHIAHLQVVQPEDVGRFRALNVVANFQPFWAFQDRYVTELTEPYLGKTRMQLMYPINSLIESGAVVVAGSDWSVSTPSVIQALHVAVNRSEPGKANSQVFNPSQRASLAAMLAAYCTNGAYLRFKESQRGSIEAGKAADLVVLDQDLFSVPKQNIHQVKVLLTIFESETVYQDPSFSAY